jgi:hypothetical protein
MSHFFWRNKIMDGKHWIFCMFDVSFFIFIFQTVTFWPTSSIITNLLKPLKHCSNCCIFLSTAVVCLQIKLDLWSTMF